MKNDLEQNQKTLTKIISLLVAILLWARFSGMVEETEDTLQQVFSQINMVYDNPESMKVNANNYQFLVTLSGPRSQIQQVQTTDILISLDLNGFAQGAYTLPLTRSNISLPDNLDQLEVVEVVPDQVAVELVEYSTKEIPITATPIGTPHPDYEYVELVLEPSTVTLEGPTDRIAESTLIVADPVDIGDLKRTLEGKVTFNFEQQIPQDTVIVGDFQKFRYRAVIREKTQSIRPEAAYKVVYDATSGVLVEEDRVRAEIIGPITIMRWIDPSWLRPVIEIPPEFGSGNTDEIIAPIRVPVSANWNIPPPLLSFKPDLLNNTLELQVIWTPDEVEVRKP